MSAASLSTPTPDTSVKFGLLPGVEYQTEDVAATRQWWSKTFISNRVTEDIATAIALRSGNQAAIAARDPVSTKSVAACEQLPSQFK